MPELDREVRVRLVTRLTEVFAETAGFPADIFGIRFHEYQQDAAALGGRLCDQSTGRPYLHFLLYCPRLGRSVKQSLIEQFTTALTEVTNQPDWRPVIHICEHPYDNVGVDGKLLSDAFAECAEAKFYYELPKD